MKSGFILFFDTTFKAIFKILPIASSNISQVSIQM